MVDETAEALRAEIDHLRRLAPLVTDARVGADIQEMIEELEKRLRELGVQGLSGGQARPIRRGGLGRRGTPHWPLRP
jgi:hypothetical protein